MERPVLPPEKTAAALNPLQRIVGGALQLVMLIPVVATMVAAIALMVYGAVETWHFVVALFDPSGHIDRDTAILLAIEIVDLFLLAVVVEVVSLGLYQLYFHQDLAVPRWLKIETLDDLKSKLVGVVITVMAVFFLGRAIVWDGTMGIAYLGIGVALVIAALTYFLSKIHDPE